MTIRCLLAGSLLAVLAGCGADGEPERPEPRATPGIVLSGQAAFGIAGGR